MEGSRSVFARDLVTFCFLSRVLVCLSFVKIKQVTVICLVKYVVKNQGTGSLEFLLICT